MLKKVFIGFLLVVSLTSVFGRIIYFNRPVFQCYSGNVTVTKDNIELLQKDTAGSCLEFGLEQILCNNTYGCFVTSSRPSEAPGIGDTLSFGCGELKPCNEEPGFNCCTDDK